MVTPLIAATQLAKAYGGHVLFDDATFQIMEGDRVAIVGPNGAGKSTLLGILSGRVRPDHGTLQIQPVRTHWFDQHPTIATGATLAELLSSDRAVPPALAAEKAKLEQRIADPALYEQPGYEAVLERYAALEREIDTASTPPSIDEALLSEMGFSSDDLTRKATELSGGQKTRIRLARTLMDVRPGDMVVLDEPTNHLDIESIEWLEGWLETFEGTLLVVAHDRAFLDNVARRVFEVTQGHIRTYEGNYEDYVQARDEDLARARRDHAKAEKRMEDTKAVLQQFRKQKRFDGQFASRKKTLAKYEAALDRSPDPVLEKLGFGVRFEAAHKSSDEIMRLSNITKSYDGTAVLGGLDFEVSKGDRIGLVGANGSGKTTLLNLITGRTRPDTGTIRVAPGVKGKFLSQEHDSLEPGRTLREEVLDARGGLEDRDVKALLGRFRFDADIDAGRKVATLSGGERQRMMLLKAILEPINLLIMDEPTNHLDLSARDVVIHAVNSYHGTLLVVSHDRFLLDSVTDKTAVLKDGRVQIHPGSFSEARAADGDGALGTDRTRVYVVRKRFTDWGTQTRYVVNQEVALGEDDLEGSISLRNALRQGWLARREA